MRGTSALAAAVLLLSVGAHAQVRIVPDTSPYFNFAAARSARVLFGQNGYFIIAGGVVLGGHAAFYVERNGAEQALQPDAVRPTANRDGTVSLNYDNISYPVRMPAGLACPLGEFIARNGVIAYTVQKYMDPDSGEVMMRAGLRHHRIAREFDGTPFEALLRAADFAATTPLSQELAHELTASVNDANGLGGFVIDAADANQGVGSLINTDMQVTYRVYLEPAKGQVEIGGVPLRYYWELDPSGKAGVFAVEAFSQNWASGTTLSNPASLADRPSQYDIVNFYQVAGLFYQLHRSVPGKFDAFVDQACRPNG